MVKMAPLHPVQRVAVSLLPCVFETMEQKIGRDLDNDMRKKIERILATWLALEQHPRAEAGHVLECFRRLKRSLTSTRRFRSLLDRYSSSAKVADSYAFSMLDARMVKVAGRDWRNPSRDQIGISAVAEVEIDAVIRNIQAVYGHRRGGARDHGLEPLVVSLADVCRSIGVKTTVISAVVSDPARRQKTRTIRSGPFVEFVSAVVDVLALEPERRPNDLGSLIARVLSRQKGS